MKKITFKKEKFLPIVGVVIIFVGFLIFTAGKPSPDNPNIIDPTWKTMLIGFMLCLVGWLIGRKHFKTYLDDPNIRWIRYNLIESYK